MHQQSDRLAGVKVQAAIRTVRAGAEAGNVEGEVRRRQAASLEIEKDRVHRLARSAAAEQSEQGDQSGDAV